MGEFTTHKNESIKGLDILQSEKFFILNCGYPNCEDQCHEILKNIKLSVQSNESAELLSILYIDLNIFDSAEKLNNFFIKRLEITSDSNVNIIGLIPKDRDTLREIMESFGVIFQKEAEMKKICNWIIRILFTLWIRMDYCMKCWADKMRLQWKI